MGLCVIRGFTSPSCGVNVLENCKLAMLPQFEGCEFNSHIGQEVFSDHLGFICVSLCSKTLTSRESQVHKIGRITEFLTIYLTDKLFLCVSISSSILPHRHRARSLFEWQHISFATRLRSWYEMKFGTTTVTWYMLNHWSAVNSLQILLNWSFVNPYSSMIPSWIRQWFRNFNSLVGTATMDVINEPDFVKFGFEACFGLL